MTWLGPVIAAALVPLAGWAQTAPEAAELDNVEREKFFEANVRPLLIEHCVECHGPDDQSGELRLDRQVHFQRGGGSGPLVVAGDPDASRLIRAIGYQDNELQMPPDNKLSDEQIAVFTQWVRQGAYWPDDAAAESDQAVVMTAEEMIEAQRQSHWSFQPIVANQPPDLAAAKRDPSASAEPSDISGSQDLTAIDRFVRARLEQAELSPNPQATRRELIHRAYFTLLGLPPAYEEVEAFVADDSPDAFARLVDRLLDNPHYGERWARHWLDIARYGDTKGYLAGSQETRYPYAFTYRDYVIDAFNKDKPFDQFIIEQLAADQLELQGDQRKALAAMGFLTVGRRFMNRQTDIIDDQIDVVTRGFLGLSVSCARCHDHKYDPVPTADYYSLYGVFDSSVEPGELPLLGEPEPSPEYQAFLDAKAAKQKEVDDWLEQRRQATEEELRSRVADYLVYLAKSLPQYEQGKTPMQGKRGPLRRAAVRRWQQFLMTPDASPHPVWALLRQMAAIPANEFPDKMSAAMKALSADPAAPGAEQAATTQSAPPAADPAQADPAATESNTPAADASLAGIAPSLLEALREAAPKSMPEAAQVIGDRLEAVYQQWKEAKLADPNIERLAKEDDEQLRQMLWAADAPTSLDREQMIAHLDQGERNQYNQLLNTVNGVEVTHPGAPPRGMVLVDKPTPVEPVIFRRGVPSNRGDRVPRRFLQVLSHVDGGKPFQQGSGRLELARAIASPDNPLTARVIVNRVWQHHFGEGLVRTPSDFGTRGETPTHPELLDFLAAEFIADGWSIKRLHRRLMLSATWQQSSDLRPDAMNQDPENRLLWHVPRRRLEFEPLRDRLLVAAGRLDDRVGGRSVMIHQDATRRGLYAYIDREDLPGLLANFDVPSPDASQAQRTETTVPQQALYLMNSEFVIAQAKALLERSRAASASTQADSETASNEACIRQMYRFTLARDPNPQELSEALHYVDPQAIESFRLAAQSDANGREQARWHFGYGHWDAAKSQVIFTPLPYFDGKSWQASEQFPDPEMHYLRITADGGHTGSVPEQSPIRRWFAPIAGVYKVSGLLKHAEKQGDGVGGQLIHPRLGVLAEWSALGNEVATNVERVELQLGETLDFAVSCLGSPSFDSFHWSPAVELIESNSPDSSGNDWQPGRTWNAAENFASASQQLTEASSASPLDPWVQLAQVLLLSNEFAFVD